MMIQGGIVLKEPISQINCGGIGIKLQNCIQSLDYIMIILEKYLILKKERYMQFYTKMVKLKY